MVRKVLRPFNLAGVTVDCGICKHLRIQRAIYVCDRQYKQRLMTRGDMRKAVQANVSIVAYPSRLLVRDTEDNAVRMIIAVINYVWLPVNRDLRSLYVVESRRPFLLNADARAVTLEDARLANIPNVSRQGGTRVGKGDFVAENWRQSSIEHPDHG